MTIESKYNIGDTVYIIYENKIQQVLITRITININPKTTFYNPKDIRTTVLYSTKKLNSGNWTDFGSIPEKDIFKTKEELLASL